MNFRNLKTGITALIALCLLSAQTFAKTPPSPCLKIESATLSETPVLAVGDCTPYQNGFDPNDHFSMAVYVSSYIQILERHVIRRVLDECAGRKQVAYLEVPKERVEAPVSFRAKQSWDQVTDLEGPKLLAQKRCKLSKMAFEARIPKEKQDAEATIP